MKQSGVGGGGWRGGGVAFARTPSSSSSSSSAFDVMTVLNPQASGCQKVRRPL